MKGKTFGDLSPSEKGLTTRDAQLLHLIQKKHSNLHKI